MNTPTICDVKPHLNYSLNETRQILKISTRKLYNLRKDGVIRYYLRRADSEVRIKGSEILKFYNS